ncbi:MAG: Outer rane efflux protein [Hydrocarboniphaga sp.]|uniref:TolC family protein n=1 Tax=Hydrocarboniphaga sp. TaxID=2033016 RepID=UPI0026378B6B|nr:TolC family protein [Hydrocarboniphaga sp.]MDB5969775.1 Outer rane efflux protein [Hydrocarboniphaga sp.]
MGQRTLAWSVKGLMLLGCLGAVAGPSQAQDTDLGDLRFGAAYVRAMGLSPDLNVANSALAVAHSAEKTARAAEFPQVGLKGDYDWTHQSVKGDYYGVADIDRSDTFNKYAYGLGLSQALYRPDLFKTVDLAKLNVSAAELSLDMTETKVAVSLAKDYFMVVDALEVLRGRYAELSSTIEQQRQIENRQSSGLVKESDVALVRAARASAEANKIDAEDMVQSARLKLALTVGGEFKRIAVLQPQTPLPRLDPGDLQSWIRTALDKQPALAAARTAVQASRVGIELSKSRRLPKVDIIGSHAYFDSDGGISGARRDLDQRIGVEVTLPLFTSGAISADIDRANAQLAQSEAKLSSAELQVKIAVQSAWMSAASSYRQIEARRHAVEAATDSANSTQVGLEVGTETTAEWLAAVRRRYEAERDFARERLAYLGSLIELKAAAGVLNREDMARIELLLKFPEPGWPTPPPDVSSETLPASTHLESN